MKFTAHEFDTIKDGKMVLYNGEENGVAYSLTRDRQSGEGWILTAHVLGKGLAPVDKWFATLGSIEYTFTRELGGIKRFVEMWEASEPSEKDDEFTTEWKSMTREGLIKFGRAPIIKKVS